MNKNCLSYWFPRIEEAGLPVPKTAIVKSPDLLSLVMNGSMPKGWDDFILRLAAACKLTGGFPTFLRTGEGSDKHHWKDTCWLTQAADLNQHVYNLVEWSECCCLKGLPHNVWVAREVLPTKPVCTLPAYRDMPLCREFRCFVRDNELRCSHPYWLWESVVGGFKPFPDADYVPARLRQDWEQLGNLTGSEYSEVTQLATAAGKAVGGEWSVDILDTTRGWYVTDMGEAARSWHWPDCPNNDDAAPALERKEDGQ